MEISNSDSNILIKIAEPKDFFDLNLCAREFIDFIHDFKKKFLDKIFFVLTAYYNNVLAGILVAEDKSHKVDSLEKIVPIMYLHLLYINPKYRKKKLGKQLLETFLTIQKKKGIALVTIKLPQKYKKGIDFFQKNNFRPVNMDKSKIILEINLWNDYGIIDCQIISDDLNNMF